MVFYLKQYFSSSQIKIPQEYRLSVSAHRPYDPLDLPGAKSRVEVDMIESHATSTSWRVQAIRFQLPEVIHHRHPKHLLVYHLVLPTR